MPKLNPDERDAFLDEREHLLRVATVDDSGFPRIAPVWFIFENDRIVFTPRAGSVFLANLRRDERVGLSVDEEALPYRKVSVQGVAEIAHEVGDDDAWRDTYRRIVERYLPVEDAGRYLGATADQARALISVPLEGATVTSWRMPLDGEDATGIWATRYYADGTRMSERSAYRTSGRNVESAAPE